VLVLDAERVRAELDDAATIRALARAIAASRPDEAREIAAGLLERSVPSAHEPEGRP
jgi:hypothetical protein